MPQTQSSNGPSLGIHLERGQPNFTLPDTIAGHIYCNTRIVTPRAIVTIALVGRSKSKMVVRHGSWGRTYRGHHALIDGSEHTYKLFDAPLHIPVNGQERIWPFSVTAPTHFDAIKTSSGTPQDESYLPYRSDESTMYPLPPSFVVQNWGYGEGMECFIEYFLRAELTTTNRGSTETSKVTQLLAITALYQGSSRVNAEWRASQHLCSLLRTEDLMEHNPMVSLPSAGQETNNLQPKLDFIIIVKIAGLLQLSKPDPISFLLLAVPTSTLPSDTALLTSQEILLVDISVGLVASTSIKCRGRRKTRHATTEKKFKPWTKEGSQNLESTIIPWMEYSNLTNQTIHDPNVPLPSHETSQALDAGNRLGIRLSDEGTYESFSTHNIQHSHRLEWRITINVAGQTQPLSGAVPVTLVAPSSHDMPIEYEMLQNELMRERTRSTSAGTVPPEYTHEQHMPLRASQQPGGAFGLSRLWEGL